MVEPVTFISPILRGYAGFLNWVAKKIRQNNNKYEGSLTVEFGDFLGKKSKGDILHLTLFFNSEESREILEFLDSRENIFVSCENSKTIESRKEFPELSVHPVLEIGFYIDDPELVLNTRFRDSIWLEGYFKIHSIQGPYQGTYSYMLKGVGVENIK